ncbi:MAG: Urease accessory protein UreG [Firmicutes bacterium]|nr:Urease accessory protein UreG [candidate division NPL-UPA2 bacterium]
MRLVIVAGPPATGKTSVMVHTLRHILTDKIRVAVCKIDCLETSDHSTYRRLSLPVMVGLSDYICPDHFYVSNLEEIFAWGEKQQAEILVVETAGLCHRCAPGIKGCLSICVVDNLSGIDTPKKVGPVLTTADVVVVTKGDIVSQAEREVFRRRIEMVNPAAHVLEINGLTGQGALRLKKVVLASPSIEGVEGRELRYPMPSAVCSYCNGETVIGSRYQMGNVKKIVYREVSND